MLHHARLCDGWSALLLHHLAAGGVLVVPIVGLVHVLRLAHVVPGVGVVKLGHKGSAIALYKGN